jgi:hypothetical protein
MLWFTPQIKLTADITILESGVQRQKPYSYFADGKYFTDIRLID